jgi:hypothetical protein
MRLPARIDADLVALPPMESMPSCEGILGQLSQALKMGGFKNS